jgi:hypothetical protein
MRTYAFFRAPFLNHLSKIICSRHYPSLIFFLYFITYQLILSAKQSAQYTQQQIIGSFVEKYQCMRFYFKIVFDACAG